MPVEVKSGYQFGDFMLLPAAHVLKSKGEVIDLAPKEFKALVLLVESAGQVITKEVFIGEVWDGAFVGDGSLPRTISVLRKQIGAGAIETVTRLGYRFVLPVQTIDLAPVLTESSSAALEGAALLPSGQPNPPLAPKITRPRRRGTFGTLMVALFLTIVGWAGWIGARYPRGGSRPPSPAVRIAVLPLRSLPSTAKSDLLQRQLTEELISALGQADRSRIRVLDGRSSDAQSWVGTTPKDVAGIVGARYLVDGTLIEGPQTAKISLHLVDGLDDSILWSGQYERKLSDLPQLQVDLAEAASREILLSILPSQIGTLHPGETDDPIAQRDYLDGRLSLEEKNVPAFRQALSHFREAVQMDPRFARAYAGIAEAYINLAANIPAKPALAEAKLAAQTALKIDNRVAEAHRDLAWILFIGEADLQGADREYREALKLNPNDACTHHWYAQLLMAERRSAEALREAQTGLDIDPISLSSMYNYGSILIFAGKQERAIPLLSDLVTREPTNEIAMGYLGLAYEEQGEYTKAIQCMRKAMNLSALKYQYEAAMAFSMAKVGQKDAARRIADDLSNKAAHGTWIPAYNLAMLYAGLGKTDEAFRWIDKCIDDRSCSLFELNNNPIYRELHGDARLAAATRRLGWNKER